MPVETYVATVTRADRRLDEPVTKVGGRPVFVEPGSWPACRRCGRGLNFWAQIRLDAPLQLSGRYAMAYLFACPNRPACGFAERGWDGCDEVGEVLLQRRLVDPFGPVGAATLPDYALTFARAEEPAATIVISDATLDEGAVAQVHAGTKLGGVPFWYHTAWRPACPACGGPTRFAFQLGTGPVGDGDDVIDLDGSSFGTGYVFLCERECGERGAVMVWQHMG